MNIISTSLPIEKNAIVINDEISKAVDVLETSGISLNMSTINYSDINYLSALALLVRQYNSDINRFTLTVTRAIDVCIESLQHNPGADYEIEYKNIFNLSPIGLETTLRCMGYTTPLVFALYLVRENLFYKQHKPISNNQSITVNNNGKSGVAKSLV